MGEEFSKAVSEANFRRLAAAKDQAERAEGREEAGHLRAGQGQTETFFQLRGNKYFSGVQVVQCPTGAGTPRYTQVHPGTRVLT